MTDYQLKTAEHIEAVRNNILRILWDLTARSATHDQSKLTAPERELFAGLPNFEYGTPEYAAQSAMLGEALAHHYAANDHHPEHFVGGVADMNLMQLCEMLADWQAATARHPNDNMGKSLEFNARRFGIDPQLARILANTAQALGWLE